MNSVCSLICVCACACEYVQSYRFQYLSSLDGLALQRLRFVLILSDRDFSKKKKNRWVPLDMFVERYILT